MNLKTEFLTTCGTVMPHVIDDEKPDLDTVYLFAPKIRGEFIGYQILRVFPPFKTADVMVLDDNFSLSKCGKIFILDKAQRKYQIQSMHDALQAERTPCHKFIEDSYHKAFDAIHVPLNHVFVSTLVGLFTTHGVLECIIDLGDPWSPKKLKSA